MEIFEVSELAEQQFYRLTGVKRSVFEQMVDVVRASLSGFGCPPKLSVEDMVLLSLSYWREYRTPFPVGCSFGVSEATVSRTVRAVESALLQDERFHLPGKKALCDRSLNLVAGVVDASEQRIERPQKTAALLLRQEKGPHPEGQLVINQSTRKIVCVQVAKGKTHDFALFKRARACRWPRTSNSWRIPATKASTSSTPTATPRTRKANVTPSRISKNNTTNVWPRPHAAL